ncbi:DEAD/DEAH box helicase, partial [Arcticibacter sp.]|uniref:DEAD/DEAH box helicase n=1 Tax=Arcticibacter sp. TaxID=1872630 RepID=UPI00388F0078
VGTIMQSGKVYKIEFAYRPKITEAVKELPERRFRYEEKIWEVPVQHHLAVKEFARKYGLEFHVETGVEPETNFVIPPLPELTIDIPTNRPMLPWQPGGVAYAIQKQRLIFGDDMGLGKTSQSIIAIEGLHTMGKEVFPCLVICPSAVKENWAAEISMNVKRRGIVLKDSIKQTFPEFYRTGMSQFFIVNYESLKKYFVERIDEVPKGKQLRLEHIHFKQKYLDFFKSVIVDESHKIKSIKSQNCKFTKGICIGKETVFLLTGTPIVNKPMDLVSQIGVLGRMGDFGGFTYFKKRYCSGPKEASNLKELNYKLNLTCFYRRNKTDPDIKKYLPDKMRQVIQCELDPVHRKEYGHAQADLESYMVNIKKQTDEQVAKSMKGEVMVRIGILKNISARGKLKDAFSFIQDIIDNGQKIVVFASLRDVIAKVQEKFPNSVRVTGAEDGAQKQHAVDRFQNDPKINVIVLNLKAGGVGINGLQNVATQICFIEFGWHAAIMDQAEDRLYRTGQHSNVMCTYFLGKDTIDEWN